MASGAGEAAGAPAGATFFPAETLCAFFPAGGTIDGFVTSEAALSAADEGASASGWVSVEDEVGEGTVAGFFTGPTPENFAGLFLAAFKSSLFDEATSAVSDEPSFSVRSPDDFLLGNEDEWPAVNTWSSGDFFSLSEEEFFTAAPGRSEKSESSGC